MIIPSDFSALHALKILKTFEIRTFFYEKWLLSHVFGVVKSYFFVRVQKIWLSDPGIII